MRYLWVLVCLGVIVALVGCVDPTVSSLHPLYRTPTDVTFDETLLGSWSWLGPTEQLPADATTRSRWMFTKSSRERTYDVMVIMKIDKDEHNPEIQMVGEWEARLVKIGKREFLDLSPRLPTLEQSEDFAKGFIARLHLFLLITRNGDQLYVHLLGPEWWQKQLRHVKPPQELYRLEGLSLSMVTTTTKDMRTLLSTANLEEELHLPDFRLQRISPNTPAKQK